MTDRHSRYQYFIGALIVLVCLATAFALAPHARAGVGVGSGSPPPNASALTGTVPVANGGTGATTLTGILKGNGTSAVTACTTSACIFGAISDESGTGLMAAATNTAFLGTITGVNLNFSGSITGGTSVTGRDFIVAGTSAAAQGKISYSASTGLNIMGKTGSGYDMNFVAADGTELFANLTGTHNLEFTGALTGITNLTATGLTDSGLTSGRVTYAGTSGLLSDDSGFTYNSGTHALTTTTFVGALTGHASLDVALTDLGTGVFTFLGTPSSANLRGAVTDESGTGALLFAGGNFGAEAGASLALGGCTIGTDGLCVTGTVTISGALTTGGNVSIGGASLLSVSSLQFTGSGASGAAWTTGGFAVKQQARVYTDTSSAGTIAAEYINAYLAPTLAFSTATVVTNPYNAYVVKPICTGGAGGNKCTATNGPWALGADNFYDTGVMQVGGDLTFTGTIPTVSSCGTTPSITTGSTDSSGEVTEGATATGCTITFSTSKTNAPFCVVTFQTNLVTETYAVSTTTITLTNTSSSGTKVNYHCTQH